MSRIRLALTGYPDRSKHQAGEYLEKEHGFKVFYSDDFLQTEANKEGEILASIKDFANFQEHLRRVRSATFIADFLLSLPEERTAFVGMRNRLDATALKAAGGLLVAMVTPEDIEESNPSDDIDSYGSQVGFLNHHPDYQINIHGATDSIRLQIDQIIEDNC